LDLTNDFDITKRIRLAWGAYAGLRPFFQNKSVSIRAKKLIFMAIPLNILLWGVESWALTKKLRKKLNVCYRNIIRRILAYQNEA